MGAYLLFEDQEILQDERAGPCKKLDIDAVSDPYFKGSHGRPKY